jgi:hypothetical protein
MEHKIPWSGKKASHLLSNIPGTMSMVKSRDEKKYNYT